ncbi:MAG: hypothetical protein KQH83_05420 [Actinobacteria bacterium]|nr:hypothetical protein [Actinomycetota bacterium]
MGPGTAVPRRSTPGLQFQSRILRLLRLGLVLVVGLLAVAMTDTARSPAPPAPAAASTSTVAAATTAAPATSLAASASTTSAPEDPSPPPLAARYVVPDTEIEPEMKQLAVDVAYALTSYEQSDDPAERFSDIAGTAGADVLAAAGEPLTHAGQWSRGDVVYPQMGGLKDGKASVMVVTRQSVGRGAEPAYSVVRTLDIRLVTGESGWEFDELASAGGRFGDVEDLALAHAVASDPRIEMPDSARLDIVAGEVSPVLLGLMADLAEVTPYGVTVMMTGHPYHVFGTDRVSHHTIGRAIDIYRVGDDLVVDDRDDGSAARAIAEWLYARSDVVQVGSPWDLDGDGDDRSFADLVHQDHIHVAVVGES